jgi:AcrR family transcriptional regulator
MPVFWKHGFADTSLQDLERATGVNKSGLYTEFRDKEDLFLACLRHHLESQNKRGLLTKEPLGWKNIEMFLKSGPLNKGESRDVSPSTRCGSSPSFRMGPTAPSLRIER